MDRIEKLFGSLDDALSKPQDAVAEKVCVKQHLTKLDSLLKLLMMLNNKISEGKFCLTIKTHASAAGVLARHSAGFESLAKIETECKDIIRNMFIDLTQKLSY